MFARLILELLLAAFTPPAFAHGPCHVGATPMAGTKPDALDAAYGRFFRSA